MPCQTNKHKDTTMSYTNQINNREYLTTHRDFIIAEIQKNQSKGKFIGSVKGTMAIMLNSKSPKSIARMTNNDLINWIDESYSLCRSRELIATATPDEEYIRNQKQFASSSQFN